MRIVLCLQILLVRDVELRDKAIHTAEVIKPTQTAGDCPDTDHATESFKSLESTLDGDLNGDSCDSFGAEDREDVIISAENGEDIEWETEDPDKYIRELLFMIFFVILIFLYITILITPTLQFILLYIDLKFHILRKS